MNYDINRRVSFLIEKIEIFLLFLLGTTYLLGLYFEYIKNGPHIFLTHDEGYLQLRENSTW